jgi:hypothetical protein
MGGSISVDSALGRGARFTVVLPVHLAHAAADNAAACSADSMHSFAAAAGDTAPAELVVAAADAAPPPPPPPQEQAAHTGSRRRRVLLVDDHQLNLCVFAAARHAFACQSL